MDTGIVEPRIRVNRSTSLALTTSWQDIDFNGTSSANSNTFGKNPETGNNMVWYDSSTKLFRFYDVYDKNYIIRLDPSTISTLITVRSVLQYRFVIPNGVSAGVDYYFPYSDDGGYGDIGEVTIISVNTNHRSLVLPIFVENKIRNNGFKLQLRLSNTLVTLGTCTLNSIALLIH